MTHQVQLAESGTVFQVEEGESILDAALRSGVQMAHECQFGGCATCRIKLESGSVGYEEFPMALTEEEHARGYALACQARPLTDVVVSPAAKGLEFAPSVVYDAEVEQVEPVSGDVSRLVLRLPADTALDFRPGQYMNILLEDGSTRSFSMASAGLGANRVDFHIRRIPGGRFTERRLGELQPGHKLTVELPLGAFCYREEDWRPLVFVATGTGLAPIKAILESLLDNGDCPPVSLYWGMRTERDLYMADVISSWKDRLYEFNFVPVLSRPSAEWTGRRGYVQQAVVEDLADLSEHALYLCGSPTMISDAKSLFVQHGADLDYVYSDSFTFQHALAEAA